jgi:hypothetical protein
MFCTACTACHLRSGVHDDLYQTALHELAPNKPIRNVEEPYQLLLIPSCVNLVESVSQSVRSTVSTVTWQANHVDMTNTQCGRRFPA